MGKNPCARIFSSAILRIALSQIRTHIFWHSFLVCVNAFPHQLLRTKVDPGCGYILGCWEKYETLRRESMCGIKLFEIKNVS